MASTGDKVVSTQIIDHVDGQPSIVLSNGNWGVFDPKTNMYKDTGIKASPEDDSSAVKYYKLGNVTTPPEAPSQTGGWSTLASLNASLITAGWAEDPLQTESSNRFCWIATYGKENIVDTVATEAQGHLVFKPKFTRTNVRLWSNYANSPTISVVGNEIIITNPDGTVIKQKFASTEAINDLTTLINSLQAQVDGAIYSYSMEGVPTLNTLPTTDWRLDSSGSPITDPATIADIYKTHVGDTYTDLLTYRSYRFSQTGASGSDPTHYEWKIIEDDALSAALGEIAQLGREKITVFTVEPNKPYKKGDMWLDGEVMLHAIQSSEVFNLAHWVQPYATKAEVSVIEADLQAAAADATLAKDNLAALETNLTNMTGTVADAIKDNIISDTELMDLNAELKQLDIDQESLLTTVNYLLSSTYLPTEPKETLQTRSNASIGVGGSMDIYQAQISTMITDRVITAQERADYLSKFNDYKNDLKLLNEAISGAKSAIEGELKRLADEKVDNIEIGGRNYILTPKDSVSNDTHRRVRIENGVVYWEQLTNITSPYRLSFSQPLIKGDYIISFKSNTSANIRRFINTSSGTKDFTQNKTIQINENEWLITGLLLNLETSNTSCNVYGTYPFEPTKEVAFWDFKLEKGTKATDWTPAPEDVQASIDEAVIKATYWSIKSSSPVIYKDSNSATASGVHTPVIVNGELRSGTTTTQGGFISIQPNGGTESTATASPRTIAPTNTEGKTSYTVRLYEGANKAKLLDTMTIPVVFKGSSGINVAMSNEADVLPASPTGVVSDYADTGNVIRVFEGSNELQYSVTAGNGKYNVTAVGTGITVGTKSASGLACSFANASNMTTDSAKIVFTISGKTSDGTSFSFDKIQNFSKSKIGADGADGEGGINVIVTRQGSFRTYWRQIGDQGQILTVPEKVSEIIGGVEIGGVKYVQCKVIIYKGSVDVTASALADPTTQGKWYLNNVWISNATDTLNIPVKSGDTTYADGVDDEVRFEYSDTNAKNWKGA